MNEIQDDRTPEQTETHTILIGGYDSFLSGWGKAEGGASYAFWACRERDRAQVARWVKRRGDISNIRALRCRESIASIRRIKGAHCHIYAVNKNHPALR